MSKTTLNLRVDSDVKNRAESVLKDIGISMSAAVVLYLKAIYREKAIPFDLKAGPHVTTKKEKTSTVKKKAIKKTPKIVEPEIEPDGDLSSLPGSSSLFDALKKI